MKEKRGSRRPLRSLRHTGNLVNREFVRENDIAACSVRTRLCRYRREGFLPFIAHRLPAAPPWRPVEPATKVMVFQCPLRRITDPSLAARTASPEPNHSGVVQVSSIKTSRRGSNVPCFPDPAPDAPAQVGALFAPRLEMLFLEADPVPIEEPPHRGAAAHDPCLRPAATISSSVKSGCSDQSRQRSACPPAVDSAPTCPWAATLPVVSIVAPKFLPCWHKPIATRPPRARTPCCHGLDHPYHTVLQNKVSASILQ